MKPYLWISISNFILQFQIEISSWTWIWSSTSILISYWKFKWNVKVEDSSRAPRPTRLGAPSPFNPTQGAIPFRTTSEMKFWFHIRALATHRSQTQRPRRVAMYVRTNFVRTSTTIWTLIFNFQFQFEQPNWRWKISIVEISTFGPRRHNSSLQSIWIQMLKSNLNFRFKIQFVSCNVHS